MDLLRNSMSQLAGMELPGTLVLVRRAHRRTRCGSTSWGCSSGRSPSSCPWVAPASCRPCSPLTASRGRSSCPCAPPPRRRPPAAARAAHASRCASACGTPRTPSAPPSAPPVSTSPPPDEPPPPDTNGVFASQSLPIEEKGRTARIIPCKSAMGTCIEGIPPRPRSETVSHMPQQRPQPSHFRPSHHGRVIV